MTPAHPKATSPATDQQLVHQVGNVFIVAYRESTQLLEDALTKEGFQCEVLRQVHRDDQKGFSSSYLCMLNHRHAWERASQESKLTLILEADFVPVLGMGALPVPFDPSRDDTGIAWLYTCAPQIYSVSAEGYAQGFSTSMVAYLLTPHSARCLLGLADRITQDPGPTSYSAWDSTVDKFFREQKLKNYVSFRNYGEHGGKPNPEHRENGLSPVHRADVLYGDLAFMPFYVADSSVADSSSAQTVFLWERWQARWKGIARLATGKFLRFKIVRNSSVPLRLISFAIRRQLSTRL